jgi:hypothetical protein
MVLEKKIIKDFAVFTGFWPKYDLEMMVKVKYELRQSIMQKMSFIITTYTKLKRF